MGKAVGSYNWRFQLIASLRQISTIFLLTNITLSYAAKTSIMIQKISKPWKTFYLPTGKYNNNNRKYNNHNNRKYNNHNNRKYNNHNNRKYNNNNNRKYNYNNRSVIKREAV